MNPQSPSGVLNIDQMLQSLEKKEVETTAQVEKEHQESVVQAVQTALPTQDTSAPTPPSPAIPIDNSPFMQLIRKFFPNVTHTPEWVKWATSGVGMLLLMGIAFWMISIQYPEEVSQTKDSVSNIIDRVATVAEENLEPTGIVSTTPTVPVEYEVETPLTQALVQATQDTTAPNTAEELFDTVVEQPVDQTTHASPTTTPEETPAPTIDELVVKREADFTIPSTIPLPTIDEFKTKILNLSEQVQLSMTQVIGSSSMFLTKMTVIDKNLQTLLEEVMLANTLTQEQVDQYTSLEQLYQLSIQAQP